MSTALQLALLENLLTLDYIEMAQAVVTAAIVADETRSFVRAARADGTLEYVQ